MSIFFFPMKIHGLKFCDCQDASNSWERYIYILIRLFKIINIYVWEVNTSGENNSQKLARWRWKWRWKWRRSCCAAASPPRDIKTLAKSRARHGPILAPHLCPALPISVIYVQDIPARAYVRILIYARYSFARSLIKVASRKETRDWNDEIISVRL